jgi:predicted acetyltransferase
MPPIYERARATRPGMPSRSPVWWAQRRIGDLTPTGPAGGPLQRVVVSIDGRAEAYALYRVRLDFDHASQLPSAVVTVMEAVGGNPAGTRAVWRYLCDIDLATKILAMNLPPDHALLLLLAEPRRAHYTAYDALWVRIIDVPEALAARTYGAKDSIVLEIEDTSCPWNNGRYRLDAGEARAHRTSEPADLRLPASSLGSAYLGGISFASLAEVGAVEQKTEHAIERADRIFHVARAPWCPEVF